MKAGDMEYKYLPSALSKEPNCAPGAIKKPPKENRKSVEKAVSIAAAIASNELLKSEGFCKIFLSFENFLDALISHEICNHEIFCFLCNIS